MAAIPAPTSANEQPGLRQRVARSLVLGKLSGIQEGGLVLREDWNPKPVRLGPGGESEDAAILHIHDSSFYGYIAARGSVGAGEAFMDGVWTTPDLTAVVRVMLRNREVLNAMESGWVAATTAPLLKLFHRRNRNTRDGSRRNIAAHYDLGNEFFSRWLDPTMTYSSGVFESAEATMEQASIAKIDRLCRLLDLGPSDHLLEIGTGWGALAVHAAKHYGCRVTTTTISQEQWKVAKDRVRAAGLEDRVELLLEDYRDLQGTYDKLVSVEMIEAVGADHLDLYLRRCSELLAPDGLFALQAITIQDQHYQRALREVDFIKRYIFPGSFIPSLQAIQAANTRSTDFRLVSQQDFAPHYAETLRRWRQSFNDQAEPLRRIGYDDRFQRMWNFYLCYCEGGFDERFLGVSQMLLAKPRCQSIQDIASPAAR